MRPILSTIAIVVASLCPMIHAQAGYTTATASVPNYSNATVLGTFVNNSGSNANPTVGGVVVPTTYSGRIDASGNLSAVVVDNNLVSAKPSCWKFQLNRLSTTFTTGCIVVNGTTMNISNYFANAPDPNPSSGGSVTADAMQAAMASQTGCTSAGFFWSPASNTCIAAGPSSSGSGFVTVTNGVLNPGRQLVAADIPTLPYQPSGSYFSYSTAPSANCLLKATGTLGDTICSGFIDNGTIIATTRILQMGASSTVGGSAICTAAAPCTSTPTLASLGHFHGTVALVSATSTGIVVSGFVPTASASCTITGMNSAGVTALSLLTNMVFANGSVTLTYSTATGAGGNLAWMCDN